MHRFGQYLFIVASLLILSGCTQLAQNENGYGKTDIPQPANNLKNCQSWCHNGWCSNHCEDALN